MLIYHLLTLRHSGKNNKQSNKYCKKMLHSSGIYYKGSKKMQNS